MSQSFQELAPVAKGSAYSSSKKNFALNYNPENNRNNIYERKLNMQLPSENARFSENPLTKLLNPTDVTKSKRFMRDKLNISDIEGVKPDVYKKQRNFEGREYLDNTDIDGSQPSKLKQNKPMTGPDYKLFTKDINPDKWQSKRMVDPLKPEYDMPTRSGRKVRIGPIEKNQPKINVSPQTRRIANYVGDIQGTNPKKTNAISEDQRHYVMSTDQQFNKIVRESRNAKRTSIIEQPDQAELLKQSQSFEGQVPNSHYSRFQTYQHTQVLDPKLDISSNNIINNNNNNSNLIRMPPNSYKQQTSSFHSQKQSLVATQVLDSPTQDNYRNGDLQTRFNNYKLLIQKPTPSFVQQEQANQYKSDYNLLGPQLMLPSESPQLQNRAWSKAKNVGLEIVSSTDMRVSASRAYANQNQSTNQLGKQNFQQGIYQRGIQMNSGHGNNSTYQNQNLFGSLNPINNEITKSVEVRNQAQQQQFINDNNAYNQYANGFKVTSSAMAMNKSENQSPPQKPSMMPPTTSKMYGHFFDAKKLDQMIKELKGNGTSMNPIL